MVGDHHFGGVPKLLREDVCRQIREWHTLSETALRSSCPFHPKEATIEEKTMPPSPNSCTGEGGCGFWEIIKSCPLESWLLRKQ